MTLCGLWVVRGFRPRTLIFEETIFKLYHSSPKVFDRALGQGRASDQVAPLENPVDAGFGDEIVVSIERWQVTYLPVYSGLSQDLLIF